VDRHAWPPAALVLTAGIGSRLEPLTRSRAKPAVPIAGVPLVARILRALGAAGIADVVLNLHHRPETLTAIVGEGRQFGLKVRYTWEPAILGSAGGPRRALPLLGDGPFLIVNGDTLPTVDVRGLWEAHHTSGARVTMTLIPNPDPRRYGGVLLDPDGWVTGFSRRGDPRPSYHFFYAQVAEPAVFAGLAEGVPAASVGGVYDALIASTPRTVRGYVCDAPFIEVGTPDDYRRVHLAFATAEGRDPWTPGARCRIAPSAQVVRSILWDDVVVEAGAVVEECILTDGVRVPAGAVLRHESLIK
jgi:NDP-sugar pyrophosphorylase family protein